MGYAIAKADFTLVYVISIYICYGIIESGIRLIYQIGIRVVDKVRRLGGENN
jgi:hypothetical protein